MCILEVSVAACQQPTSNDSLTRCPIDFKSTNFSRNAFTKLTLWCLVRGEGHGSGNEGEKGDDLEGLHGEFVCYWYALCGSAACVFAFLSHPRAIKRTCDVCPEPKFAISRSRKCNFRVFKGIFTVLIGQNSLNRVYLDRRLMPGEVVCFKIQAERKQNSSATRKSFCPSSNNYLKKSRRRASS